MAQGSGLRLHECITAVEQREAFRVIELAREDYVRVELISAIFLSFDELLLSARGTSAFRMGVGVMRKRWSMRSWSSSGRLGKGEVVRTMDS